MNREQLQKAYAQEMRKVERERQRLHLYGTPTAVEPAEEGGTPDIHWEIRPGFERAFKKAARSLDRLLASCKALEGDLKAIEAEKNGDPVAVATAIAEAGESVEEE